MVVYACVNTDSYCLVYHVADVGDDLVLLIIYIWYC